MLCPYNRKRLTYVKNTAYEFLDEERGVAKAVRETYLEDYIMMECVAEECGVWRDGHCNYNNERG